MLGLLDQLETENPEDISLAPKAGLDISDAVSYMKQRAAQCRTCSVTLTEPVFPADIWRMGQCLCTICPHLQEARKGIRPGSPSTEKEGRESSSGGLYGSRPGSQSLVGAHMQLESLCAAKLFPALPQQPEGAATHMRTQVKLDRGLDFSGLDDVLVDMKLAPQILELPCPAYFREERSKV